MKTHRIEFASLLFFFICLFLLSPTYSQDTDSLKLRLIETTDLDEKYNIHLQTAFNYWESSPDSTLKHLDLAEKFSTSSENEIKVQINRGTFYNDIGDYQSAISTFKNILENTNDSKYSKLIAKTLANIGNSYSYLNNIEKAIDYYRESIFFFENSKDSVGLANVYGSLGNVFYRNENFSDALSYYFKSYNLFKDLNNEHGKAIAKMNIGNCFKRSGEYDSAHAYYLDAYELFNLNTKSHTYKAQCIANIGNLYLDLSKYEKAEKYLLIADSLFKITNNQYSLALVNINLAYTYLYTNKIEKAKSWIDRSLKISEDNKYEYQILECYSLLIKYSYKKNDFKSASIWLEKYIEYMYRIDAAERQKNIDLLLTQFETERKEKEIELLKKSDEINQLKIRKRTANLYLSLFGLMVAFTFLSFLYINNRKRKKINEQLNQQNAEINEQKNEITSQRDEIESQRDMLQNQNDMLEQFRTHTTESLRYAHSIQAAILPSEKVLQQISPEYFVLMKPCEIVSGDFFWATSFDNYHIFCVADCTGHGVPGAFMSILGITALNDIVARHRVTKPSEILGFLRESVIEALKQNDPEQLHKDGMDIALCSYNKNTKELQFAGAGIPLLIATNHALQKDIECNSIITNKKNINLFEIKGNIMPVGSSPRMKPFTNITIPLQNKSAYLYLVTDGFQDQMGGESNKKFGVKNLRNLLLENSNLTSEIQHNELNTTFEEWRKGFEQIDDVTILGIKI